MLRVVRSIGFALALSGVAVFATACSDSLPLAPSSITAAPATTLGATSGSATNGTQGVTTEQACWGQASQVFARMGVMGEHSSSYETPRMGLRNLARYLYERGDLPDDTMQSLGAFVATALELSIDACM
jgi:hypothetical protein